MKRIDFQNNKTKVNKKTFDEFQANIEESSIIVSPTEPTTNEKVWIQKGKNLFKDNLVKNLINTTYNNGVLTQITADTGNSPYFKIFHYKDSQYITVTQYTDITLGINSMSFVKDDTFNIISYGLNGTNKDTMMTIDVSHLTNGLTYTLSFNVTNITQGNISWKDIQIEQGSIATEYEEYIDKKIYCKNDNGGFEEFVNVEKVEHDFIKAGISADYAVPADEKRYDLILNTLHANTNPNKFILQDGKIIIGKNVNRVMIIFTITKWGSNLLNCYIHKNGDWRRQGAFTYGGVFTITEICDVIEGDEISFQVLNAVANTIISSNVWTNAQIIAIK